MMSLTSHCLCVHVCMCVHMAHDIVCVFVTIYCGCCWLFHVLRQLNLTNSKFQQSHGLTLFQNLSIVIQETLREDVRQTGDRY
jgi:hypothetical protein